ncbi:MAG TPA: GNAT family N-acetyltransferase [Phycisphaerales bacterium]|nr:GNAT family N-acetyltransferase [Phycisphaerales bacterium]
MPIREATTDSDIARCYDVMAELRPHIPRDDFVARVRRQMQTGYLLAFIEDAGAVVCAAGYRYVDNLYCGLNMYVDDLVTTPATRSKGHGKAMIRWLIDLARAKGCSQLHLDSAVHRFGAHRFYLREGFDITSHHFAMKL